VTAHEISSSEVPGPRTLLRPVPDHPITFLQIEEHSSRFDSAQAAPTKPFWRITSSVARDRSGKIRQESDIFDESGSRVKSKTTLTDPVDGFQVIVDRENKTAIRRRSPRGASTFEAEAFDTSGRGRDWSVAIEGLGTRLIAGIDCAGMRYVYTAENDPNLKCFREIWYSSDQDLTTSMILVGVEWVRSVRIDNTQMVEPDPALFVIPTDYELVDIP
jgi:hypothetical protein